MPARALIVHWRLPLALALLCLLAQWPDLAPYLRYERIAILQGEVWRLLSAHLTHLSVGHLALNLLGLALIWQIFGEGFSQRQWLLILVLIFLGISLGLLVLYPQVQWYVGLSGSLHGLFVAGALAQWRRGNWLGPVLLAGLALKLVREQWMGPLAGSIALTGGPVLTQAHLLGAIAGLLVAAPILSGQRR
ncbi:rhombosortase [Thermithiobacillus plumbiphilus]|uniref:Rhombosortase n=1 Tax=Thermithiobacillus plumbiphilus TaxID=1729899 RepID=A0ABU9D766_9PROT